MKILHTSDWHLGRDFGTYSLAPEQAAFRDWLVALVAERQIELVVIAGDIFDRAYASVEAIRLFGHTVRLLREAGAQVAAITGNHDGADRVANYSGLLDHSGTYIRGGYEALGEVITLECSDGPLDLVLLPFLDPQAAPDTLGTAEAVPSDADEAFQRRVRRTHESVLAAAIGTALPQMKSRRSLAVAHAAVQGGMTSESERQLSIGGAALVDAGIFQPFSYTALGHLHRPQTVGGRHNVRYSGTPLVYSFSETHAKSVTLLDLAPDGTCECEEIEIDIGRAAATITGRIDDLLRAEGDLDGLRQRFIRAIVTDPGVVLDARHRLSQVYSWVVEIELRPTGEDGALVVPVGSAQGRRGLSPLELAEQFWRESSGAAPTPRQRQFLQQALHDAAEAFR